MNGDLHEDDRDPLAGLDWADADDTPDPFCSWCGDETMRWVIRDGVAVKAPCEKCTTGEDN